MKFYFSTILILVFAFGAFGQDSVYVNEQYNFSFIPPTGSKQDTKTNYLASYVCRVNTCPVAGLFALMNIEKINSTMAEMVRLLQSKDFQEEITQIAVKSFSPEYNATVLSKKYTAFDGRPGIRVDVNFIIKDESYTGSLIAIYVKERNAILAFSFATFDAQSDKWNRISENTIRSFKLTPINSKTIKPPREGIAVRIAPNQNTIKPPREGIATRISGEDSYPPPPPLPPPPVVPKKISGGVLNGKALELPKPEYPNAAKAVRASGTVVVQITINEDGNVISATAVSGHPLLREAAEKAAFQAKFARTLLSGQPVSVVGILNYNFTP